jgi:hypothetical protein
VGKLRNAKTDIGQLTQWLGRKCRNHNPLEELKIPISHVAVKGTFLRSAPDRSHLPNMYLSATNGDLAVLSDDDGVLLYKVGARVFEITVREVGEDAHAGKARVAVLR